MTFTRASLTCPGLSFPSRTGPASVPGCGSLAAPNAPPRRPRGKGAEPLVPRTPYPSAWRRPTIKQEGRSQDRTLELRLATEHISPTLGRQTPVYLTTRPNQLPTPSSKSVAKITNPSLTQTRR